MKRMSYISMPKGAAKAIKKELAKKYKRNEMESLWLEIKNNYDNLQKDQPDIGGKKNPLYEQMYASIAIFAYYEATKKTATLDEIEKLAVEALIGNNRTAGKIIDFNWKWVQKIYGYLYKILKKQTDKHIADGSWHNTWKFRLNPEGRDEGVSVHLIGCLVFDFAKAHGYLEIMPALCHSDYKIFEPFHCKMIRYHTVANGDEYCDFWQVGDKSKAWKNAEKSKLL